MTAGVLLRPPPWTEQAACQGMAGAELDPWHDDQSPYAPIARRMCAGCPVRLPCALYALKAALPYGIWGGLDPTDRRRIARKHGYEQPGAAQHGTRSRYISGCRCPGCTEAHRRYIAQQRAKVRHELPPIVLEHVTGRGRWRAWPGQVLLFDVRPAATAATTGPRLAA